MQKTNQGSTSALVQGDQHRFKNGDRLGVEFFGNGREKAIFFHGFPGSRHQGRLIESQCREFDLEVAAFDRPGLRAFGICKTSKGISWSSESLRSGVRRLGMGSRASLVRLWRNSLCSGDGSKLEASCFIAYGLRTWSVARSGISQPFLSEVFDDDASCTRHSRVCVEHAS